MPIPSRIQRDALLTVTKALPAAAATNYSNSIALGDTVPESTVVEIAVPALPALADTKNATFTLQDSADNSTFADIVGLGALQVTGAGGVGSAAATRRVYLPPAVRQYLRVKQVVDSAGGDSTAVSSTLSLVL